MNIKDYKDSKMIIVIIIKRNLQKAQKMINKDKKKHKKKQFLEKII